MYGNNSKRTKVRFVGEYRNEMHLMFPQPLAEILGVDKTFFGKPIGNDKYQFKYGVDLNTHSNRFYVHSDVANYTYIGDVTAPILRVIPFKYTQGEIHFHQEFLNLHYVSVAKSYIDQVYISNRWRYSIHYWKDVDQVTFQTQRIIKRKFVRVENFFQYGSGFNVYPV